MNWNFRSPFCRYVFEIDSENHFSASAAVLHKACYKVCFWHLQQLMPSWIRSCTLFLICFYYKKWEFRGRISFVWLTMISITDGQKETGSPIPSNFNLVGYRNPQLNCLAAPSKEDQWDALTHVAWTLHLFPSLLLSPLSPF